MKSKLLRLLYTTITVFLVRVMLHKFRIWQDILVHHGIGTVEDALLAKLQSLLYIWVLDQHCWKLFFAINIK